MITFGLDFGMHSIGLILMRLLAFMRVCGVDVDVDVVGLVGWRVSSPN